MEGLSRREFLASVGTVMAGGLSGMSLTEAMAKSIETLAENMPQTVLGRTGWKTPIIGLGTMFYAKTYEGGRESFITESQSDRLLNLALDLGINSWETGRAYGKAETMIGRVLSRRRDEVFISSKSRKIKAGRVGVLRDLEITLANLQTDHLDCFALHNCSSITELNRAMAENGAVEGLKQAQKEGKTRFIGITTHSRQAFMAALRSEIFDIHVVPHNAMSLEFERGLELAGKLGATVWNMKPFGCGDTGIGLLNFNSDDPYQLQEVLTDEECMRFVLSNPGVTIAIPGSGTEAYLKRNVALAATFKPLTLAEREDIANRAARLAGGVCGTCGKPCEDICPNKVPIGFLLSNYQLDRRFLYDTRRMSDFYAVLPTDYLDCDGCGECENVCAQKFPIQKDMAIAHQRLAELRARMMDH
jgi:predicted aldo/keto reductase-like oxidoreductase